MCGVCVWPCVRACACVRVCAYARARARVGRLMSHDPKGVTGDVQLVMMGSGEERYANFLRRCPTPPSPRRRRRPQTSTHPPGLGMPFEGEETLGRGLGKGTRKGAG